MSPYIRKAEPGDASRIAEIIVAFRHEFIHEQRHDDPELYNQEAVLPLALHYQNDKGALKGIRVYDDGIVKGVLYMKEDNGGLELVDLYIDPFFHNEGVGQALAQAAADTLIEKQLPEMHLWVSTGNLHLRMLYSNAGFAMTGKRRPDAFFQREDAEYSLTLEQAEARKAMEK
jgi:GNAT superfamily N-acetyltransferase